MQRRACAKQAGVDEAPRRPRLGADLKSQAQPDYWGSWMPTSVRCVRSP